MAIPLSYNIRNLAVRKTTTIMTALGIALTVAVLASVFALTEGLRTAFQSSGDPMNIMLLRKGGTSELASVVPREAFNEAVKLHPGIAKASNGEPMASLEIVQIVNLPSKDAPDGMNLTTRGLGPIGLELRQDCKIVEGRWFQPGRREVVIGRSVRDRYADAQIGKKIAFGKGEWEIVGVFNSSQTARNSEIWADANQMSSDFNRENGMSSVLLRAQDESSRQALLNDLPNDPRVEVSAMLEKDYYEKQTSSGDPIRYLGTAVAIIMAVGSCFAAMNTMYAAVARRAKEIGTLRILGFSRLSILSSFFLESILLAAIGGILGILLVMPLNNLTTGLGSNRDV